MKGWSRAVLAAALGLGIAGLQTDASAQDEDDGVDVRFSMNYYDVTGTTWYQVSKSIFANRLMTAPGERYEGVTAYGISLTPVGSTCSAENARLIVTLAVSVPRVTRSSNLTGPDRECWASYDRSLTDHEEFHSTIALHDAQDLLAEIRGSRGASCGFLRNLVARRIGELHKTQDDYDRVSRHGLEQWRAWGLAQPADPDAAALARRCAQRALLGWQPHVPSASPLKSADSAEAREFG